MPTEEMMSTLVLPKTTSQALRELTGESRPDVALLLALRDALAYRLARIEQGLRVFETRYEMTFEQYQRQWEREERDEDYTWERERDYLKWEALGTRQHRLEDLSGWIA
jgi:hypothetical protein